MKKNNLIQLFSFLILLILGASCAPKQANSIALNQLTEQEKNEGWISLFDGKTTEGWHLYNKGKMPSAWIIQNGELYCKPEFGTLEHGDLVSDREFENFDLRFEWKISKKGNSGVFLNVLERQDIPTTWASGPEYQLLENSHHDYAMSPKKRAGALYGFIAPPETAKTKPYKQWNQSRIKQTDGKIEFYLNDVLTASYDFNSQLWKDEVAKSNFKTFPEFGKRHKGRIALQDWSKGISFRNIKIKEFL